MEDSGPDKKDAIYFCPRGLRTSLKNIDRENGNGHWLAGTLFGKPSLLFSSMWTEVPGMSMIACSRPFIIVAKGYRGTDI